MICCIDCGISTTEVTKRLVAGMLAIILFHSFIMKEILLAYPVQNLPGRTLQRFPG
jgi:hypothetical protein